MRPTLRPRKPAIRARSGLLSPWLVLAAALAAAPAAEAQTLLQRLEPPTSFGFYGGDIVCLGDVDGDGLDDHVVGHAGLGETWGSTLHLRSGRDGAELWSASFNGPEAWRRHGFALAVTDDQDGDGVPEIVTGARGGFGEIPGGGDSLFLRGEVRVLSGADGSTLQRWEGDAPTARFGSDLDVVPDVDGDGLRDVLVLAATPAVVHLLSGADGASLAQLVLPPALDELDTQLLALDDLTGDGLPEVALATSWNRGEVAVMSLDGRTLWSALGEEDDFLGLAMTRADVDGDGRDDLAVGGKALVRVFATRTGAVLREVGPADGPGPGFTATSLDGLGDRDGDGRDELLVGTAAFGVGPDEPHGWVLRGDGGVRPLHSPVRAARGLAARALGDVDGDGVGDLALALSNVFKAGGDQITLSGLTRLLVYSSRTTVFLETEEGAVAGALGAPRLSGDGLTSPGAVVTLTVSDAAPAAPLVLALGDTVPGFDTPFLSHATVFTPAVVLAGATDPTGHWQLSGRWPPLPPGAILLVQAFVADGSAPGSVAVSGVLQVTASRG